MLEPIPRRRYSLAARWFHWLTALLIFALIPLGWMFAEFKTMKDNDAVFRAPFAGSPAAYASVHKTLGLVVLAIVVARLVYRVSHRPPPLPGRLPALEKGLAHATHWLLYLTLLVMPISGYVMSSSSNKPISIFGLFDFPKLPIPRAQGEIAMGIHLYGQFVIYALVVFHLAGVAISLFLRRDDVLGRMLPKQTNAE